MMMLEQIVEKKVLKVAIVLIQEKQCRVCNQIDQTVEHLVAGCKALANNEYLPKYNRSLMILNITIASNNEAKLV